MTIISSRPEATSTDENVTELVQPFVNMIGYVASLFTFHSDSVIAHGEAYALLHNMVDLMNVEAFKITPMPITSFLKLPFEVEVQPIKGGAWVSFRIDFPLHP